MNNKLHNIGKTPEVVFFHSSGRQARGVRSFLIVFSRSSSRGCELVENNYNNMKVQRKDRLMELWNNWEMKLWKNRNWKQAAEKKSYKQRLLNDMNKAFYIVQKKSLNRA
jgi:hypothetical protein